MNGADSGRAVDGRREPDSGSEEGCTATGGYDRSDNWWWVNLEGMYAIRNVVIYNRRGSCKTLWMYLTWLEIACNVKKSLNKNTMVHVS